MKDTRPKTIFCDIDGTIFVHRGDICSQHLDTPILLPGVKEIFQEWDKKGYHIILITGRRESVRKSTEQQLAEVGIFYDQLIMGIGGGTRVLINDKKPESDINTSISINLIRNQGLEDYKGTV